MQICKKTNCNNDWGKVELESTTYPFTGREFVPGMAQIYKGQKTKGYCFIAGEVVFVGGIVATQVLKSDYMAKLKRAQNSNAKRIYANNASICSTVSYVCIAGAEALYAWNIIDGAVAKGKSHVVVDGKELSFMPIATPDYGGLALNITF